MDQRNGKSSPRVLVMENDSDTGYLMGKMLFRLGLTGVPASNSQAALAAIATMAPIELVIVDAQMDNEGGIAIALKVKGECCCPVIVTSGNNPPDEGLPEGIDLWFVKPVDIARMEEAVDVLLEH